MIGDGTGMDPVTFEFDSDYLVEPEVCQKLYQLMATNWTTLHSPDHTPIRWIKIILLKLTAMAELMILFGGQRMEASWTSEKVKITEHKHWSMV